VGPLQEELRRFNALRREAAKLRAEEERFERLAEQQHPKIEKLSMDLNVATERRAGAAATRDHAAELASGSKNFAEQHRQRVKDLRDQLKIESDAAKANDLRDEIRILDQRTAAFDRRAATFDQRVKAADTELQRAEAQVERIDGERMKAVTEQQRLLKLAEERETAAEKVEAEIEKIAPVADAGDQSPGSSDGVAVAAMADGVGDDPAALDFDDASVFDDPAALDDTSVVGETELVSPADAQLPLDAASPDPSTEPVQAALGIEEAPPVDEIPPEPAVTVDATVAELEPSVSTAIETPAIEEVDVPVVEGITAPSGIEGS
jgi:hypothetical protein